MTDIKKTIIPVTSIAPTLGEEVIKAGIVPAHTQGMTTRYALYYPEHEPRETDTHYRLFHAARTRLERLGALRCWRCGAIDDIQLHHAIVEFALANGVDIAAFSRLYPEFHVADDETFLDFVESEGNLMPLCVRCHIGEAGIHSLPYPAWIAGRFWRHELPEPARKV